VARTVDKELTCPSCGVVVAHATYRRTLLPPGGLELRTPEGAPVVPESVALQLQRARERDDLDAVGFLQRHLTELVVELRCRNDHRTLRTVPQLVRAVREARGQWVDLSSSR
jgi:hypothetical protein